MNISLNSEDRIHELLLLALDEQASAQDLSELNDLLAADKNNSEIAANYLLNDSYIREQFQTIEQASSLQLSLKDFEGLNKIEGADIRPQVVQKQSNRNAILRYLDTINQHGLIVAAVLLVIGSLGLWQYLSLQSQMSRLHEIAAAPDPFELDSLSNKDLPNTRAQKVARVTGLIDCKWSNEEEPIKFGTVLKAGQEINLEEGVMQLTLESGARVLIEGPAQFVTTSRSETELNLGRIAATVPRAARGYTVMTPTSEIVDLGTEFGVEVQPSGNSLVSVFDGKIVARNRNLHSPENNDQVLHADKAVAYEFVSANTGMTKLDSQETVFKQRLESHVSRDLPTLPVTDNLSLWLSSEQLSHLREGDKVSTWHDLLIGDNNFANDAWQFENARCPTLVIDEKGKPAVGFNGWNTSLSTAPTDVGSQYSAIIVCQPGHLSFADHPFGGILVRTGPLAVAVKKDRSPVGWIWAGWNKKPAKQGVSGGKKLSTTSPSIVQYNYDAIDHTSQIVVNGEAGRKVKNSTDLPAFAQHFIGRSDIVSQKQYFLGSIYEVLIYDSILDAEQNRQLLDCLAERHKVVIND